MYRRSKRSFMLVTVLVLLSLAAVAETLAARYLVRLNRHVAERRQVVRERLNGSIEVSDLLTTRPSPVHQTPTTVRGISGP